MYHTLIKRIRYYRYIIGEWECCSTQQHGIEMRFARNGSSKISGKFWSWDVWWFLVTRFRVDPFLSLSISSLLPFYLLCPSNTFFHSVHHQMDPIHDPSMMEKRRGKDESGNRFIVSSTLGTSLNQMRESQRLLFVFFLLFFIYCKVAAWFEFTLIMIQKRKMKEKDGEEARMKEDPSIIRNS